MTREREGARKLEHRIIAGDDEEARPRRAPRQGVVTQRREDASARQGGFPAPRRADDAGAAGRRDHSEELGNEALAAEVPVRVLGLEPQEALVRTRPRGGRASGAIGAAPAGWGGTRRVSSAPIQGTVGADA